MKKRRMAFMLVVIRLFLLVSSPVLAQEGAATSGGSMAKGLIGLGAGLAIGLAALGGGIGQGTAAGSAQQGITGTLGQLTICLFPIY